MKNVVNAVLLVSSLFLGTAQAGIIFYDNQTDWEAAVGAGNVVTEDFSDTTLIDGLTITSDYSSFAIAGGNMEDRLAPGQTDTTFSFDSEINAFGGLFDLAGPGGQGTGILVTLSTGEVLTTEISPSLSGEFFGFVSDNSFNAISFNIGTSSGRAETYNMSSAFVASVPEPTSIALLSLGLIAFAARSKSKS